MAVYQYYQLGGFRPAINWFPYDDNKLANVIAGDKSPLRSRTQDSKEPIELVLGIRRSGASYILLTRDQTQLFVRSASLPYPSAAPALSTEFESLSPIYFRSANELSKRLSIHKPKSKKGRFPADTSQANKQFASGDDGVHRGAFEHSRVLYRILKNSIDIEKFGLEDASWIKSLQICSLTFNLWFMDRRSGQERQRNPKLMDLGFAEVSDRDLSIAPGSSMHFIVKENSLMGQGSAQTPANFKFGATETLDWTSIASRLQHIFKDRVELTDRPSILLVCGDEITRSVMRNYGVDVSRWESGIKGLLGYAKTKGNEPSSSRPGDPRLQHLSRRQDSAGASNLIPYDGYNSAQYRPRSRSRSPKRSDTPGDSRLLRRSPPHHHSDPYASWSSERNSRTAKYAPVYLVDIQQMYIKLLQTRQDSESVASMARHFQLSLDQNGWCAGNDSHQIIDMWRSMVEGPTIDEQRALRQTAVVQPSAGPSQPQPSPAIGDSDDDRDPNDIIQIPSAAIQAQAYDDESDYGEDSD